MMGPDTWGAPVDSTGAKNIPGFGGPDPSRASTTTRYENSGGARPPSEWPVPPLANPVGPPRWRYVALGIGLIAQGLRIGMLTAHQSAGVVVLVELALLALIGAGWTARRHRNGRSRPITTDTPTVVIAAVVVVSVLVASFAGRALVHRLTAQPSISGAPGYLTSRGPHGRPLATGRPWGQPCEPIVFAVDPAVPDDVYAQIAQTVNDSRSLGVDVTVEDRQGFWQSSELYPPGLTNSGVKFVYIYPNWNVPPLLPNGQPEHIQFGWGAYLDVGNAHEILSGLQADLFLKAMVGNPTASRIATRQLVAFSQGVTASTSAGSGIARGTTVDSYSPADLRAMQRMSGCAYSPSGSTPVPTGN